MATRNLSAPRTAAQIRAPRSCWTWPQVAALVVVGGSLLGLYGWLLGAFDLESGLRAGRALLDGRSPYSPVTSPVFRAGHAFVYPYLVAWAFVPLAPLPVPLAVTIFVGLSVGAILVACHLLGRPGWLPAALVLSSSTTIVGLQMGTVNALLLLGAAVAWSQRDHWVVAGLAVAATAVAKLFLLPLLAWLVLARRLRAAALAAGTLAVILGGGWVLGPLSEHSYSAMLGVLQDHEAASSWSLTSLFDSLGTTPAVAEMLAIAVAGAVVVGGALRAHRSGDERNLFAASIIASLMATPIMWSSYLLILASVVLLVATDDRTVAALAAASWIIVTPDVASYPRIAAGMALTGVLAGVAFWPSVRDRALGLRAERVGRVMLRRARPALAGSARRAWRAAPVTAVLLASIGALLLAPPAVRSPLPAILLMVAAGVEVARRTHRDGRGSPGTPPAAAAAGQ
ncbi:glycosyltransferase 87 family protein [Acidiferrimicrobium sp. IK]|uniref:glycosyltransferase 87 family protein n=1 Tax=Acidiferrimicrobium sp. IK TaxID=2871700 RepID=UPI0021CB734B|nr:glycosyltransferase 87 family protein [Acidiferrimicrobium sp. IK]MCU4186199.1 glycosyltransferase 87 family protein [Acidiferrimicrobium sp. IK]